MALHGIENLQGRPVYVHAKVCVVDDTWASVGSDNFNRRSWTHDSELSATVCHADYARDLRTGLTSEHLGAGHENVEMGAMFATLAASAATPHDLAPTGNRTANLKGHRPRRTALFPHHAQEPPAATAGRSLERIRPRHPLTLQSGHRRSQHERGHRCGSRSVGRTLRDGRQSGDHDGRRCDIAGSCLERARIGRSGVGLGRVVSDLLEREGRQFGGEFA